MINILGIIFGLAFLGFCFWRWQWALAFFCLALPTYLIKLKYFGLPTTVLEIMFGALMLSWVVAYARKDWLTIKDFFISNRWFSLMVVLFFIASVVGIFISGTWFKSLGQWRAYFLEPIVLFFVLIGRNRKLDWRLPVFGLLGSGLAVVVVALMQKFFLNFYAPSLWNDNLNGRVTSFFTSPNTVGLFLIPLVPLLLWLVIKKYQEKKTGSAIFFSIIFLLFLVAIFFSYSQGAWIGLGAAVVVFLFSFGYRKISIGLVVLGVMTVLLVPNIRSAVMFQDKASQNRLVLWSNSGEFLTASPKNFVFGTGIRSFYQKIEKPLFRAGTMEKLIYPHNVLLNFWTETGLFGVIGFIGLMSVSLYWIFKNKNRLISATWLAVWTGFVVHGLVDVPYFKNDLAFLFWILIFFSWWFNRAVILEKK